MLRTVRLTAALLIAVVSLSGCIPIPNPFEQTLIVLSQDVGETDDAFQIRVRQAFSLAQPGTVLEFGPGTFRFTAGLIVGASHVTVRGAGIDETTLDFDDADAAEAILATGDQFLIRDIAILEPPGDGVKAVGIDGFTAQNVRVEWASFADPNNGPYGIYPVLSQNILIEGCHVIGAEDAGIYVGQSANALVRYNLVERSVAGIEIENTIGAEVWRNATFENTAGILVFDLPGLSQPGRGTSVHENVVFNNNGPNFGSGVVGLVPPGTGMLILATDDVEIFNNQVYDHLTAGIATVSYILTLLPFDPAQYDAYPETIHVHDNLLYANGGNAQGTIGLVLELQFSPDAIPDVMWDGVVKPGTGDPFLPPLPLRFCQYDNGDGAGGSARFGVMGAIPGVDRYDPVPYDCTHPPVPRITMPDPLPLPEAEEVLSPEETAQLCGQATAGVNWDAFEANCPNLSDYNLFAGNDPRGPVVERGLEYELNTPLFSDYSNKYRFAFVPPGESATFDPDFVFDFPVGTIITKTFAFDLPGGGERVVETRLLIRRDTGWRSLVYLWDATFTEAVFTPEGAVVEVTFQHPDGNPRTIDYGVPDVNQCAGCHRGFDEPANLIGPRARNLNRPIPGDQLGMNQLAQWDAEGILSGLPALATVDKLAVWDDPADGTVDERARAYLDSNCAHCHRPMGRAGFTSLWLTTDTPEGFNLGICKTPIAAGSGSGGLTYDIDPGNPDESILAFRTDSAEPGVEMPELAKAIVHDEGVALVRAWIAGLQGSCN